MAQRFFDTNKFKDYWYRNLSPKNKCLWEYILCECSHFGIVYVDLEIASVLIGSKISSKDFSENFSDRLVHIKENKYFIPKFIEFQYKSLNTKNKATRSVITNLQELGIELIFLREDEKKEKYYKLKPMITHTSQAPCEGVASTLQGLKDKDKDKVKVKVKIKAKEIDKVKGKVKDKSTFDFEFLYKNHYPKKEGKTKGMIEVAKKVKTQEQFENFTMAILNYEMKCRHEQTEYRYIKQFSSFVSVWEDYVDYATPINQAKLTSFEQNRQNAIAYINTPREDDDEEI